MLQKSFKKNNYNNLHVLKVTQSIYSKFFFPEAFTNKNNTIHGNSNAVNKDKCGPPQLSHPRCETEEWAIAHYLSRLVLPAIWNPTEHRPCEWRMVCQWFDKLKIRNDCLWIVSSLGSTCSERYLISVIRMKSSVFLCNTWIYFLTLWC